MSSLSADRQQIKQLRKVRKQLKKSTIANAVYVQPVRPATEYIHYDNKQAIQFFNDNYVEEFKDIIDKFITLI